MTDLEDFARETLDSMDGLIRYYKLVNREPVRVTLREWAHWFEHGDRIIKQDEQPSDTPRPIFQGLGREPLQKYTVKVSTVFLGIDHGFSLLNDHVPVLFETMIFGGPHDQDMFRCCTYEEALRQHSKAHRLAFGPHLTVVKNDQADAK